ncbi:MAG: hypothetical protein PHC34_12585 [Candidatus Gastranaerophilales bacterium]|nr:hypothetical protein [Candidatus Gastranaerophilales bacterium]
MNYKKTWIIPMAGNGTRTKDFGEFKPFIEVAGKKILNWLLKSIKINFGRDDRIIFITTKYFAEKYEVESQINEILLKENINLDFNLVISATTPPGPSASVYTAKDYIDNNPTIIVNSDQYVHFNLPVNISPNSGYLPVNTDFGNTKSYVLVENGIITRVVEKSNISNIASAGIYMVSNGFDLISSIETQFKERLMYKEEFFVGPALNYLINNKYTFYPIPVSAKYDLGNIEQIIFFEKIMNFY